MSRKAIVAGNWKMNGLRSDAKALAEAVARGLSADSNVETVLCPPFSVLSTVADAIAGSPVLLGAQNMHWEKSGAFTGEISAGMLLDAGCQYVILGHSERRQYFGETDETVNRKVNAALQEGLRSIVCVGESLEERNTQQTHQVVEQQVRQSLEGLNPADWASIVVAYEPVWAIGTGLTATPEQAQEVHALIRATVASMGGEAVAEGLRIQYGGSVKPSNAVELFAQKDIDGGLIGGAALDAASFLGILEAAV